MKLILKSVLVAAVAVAVPATEMHLDPQGIKLRFTSRFFRRICRKKRTPLRLFICEHQVHKIPSDGEENEYGIPAPENRRHYLFRNDENRRRAIRDRGINLLRSTYGRDRC